MHHPFLRSGWARIGRNSHETVKQLLHTEIVQGRTEEHRCHFCFQIGVHIKCVIHPVNHFQVFTQFLCIFFSHTLIQLFRVDVHVHLLRHYLLVGCEKVQVLLIDVIDAFESSALIDRPREGTHFDLQFAFHLVKQVKRILSFTVHFVDKHDDRCFPHAAHRHQFSCLCLHTLRSVNHDDGRIHSSQRSESVFRKVLVTRCVEDVYFINGRPSLSFGHLPRGGGEPSGLFLMSSLAAWYTLPIYGGGQGRGSIVKLHHRGAHRNTSLLLNLHPVTGGSLLNFVALHRTSHLNLTAKQQQFLRQRGLTSVRVRDNRKSSSSFYFIYHLSFII